MIKKIYDKCVAWAGHRYAKPLLAFESFIESSFFPIPPDVMIIPMVVAKKNEFLRIALVATIFSVLGALFGYLIGYVFFNEIGVKIFELYGYEDPNFLKDKFSTNKDKVDYSDMSKYSNLGLYTNYQNPDYLDFDNLEAINTEPTITPKDKPITETTETDVLDYLNESP